MTNKIKTEHGSQGPSSRRKYFIEPGRKGGMLAGGGGVVFSPQGGGGRGYLWGKALKEVRTDSGTGHQKDWVPVQARPPPGYCSHCDPS